MSYILDALKKMEHEKAKKKGAGGMASISGELFRPEKQRPKRYRGWIIAVSAVVAVVVASAGVWYLLKDDSSVKKNKSPQTAATPAEKIPAPLPVPVAPAQPLPAAPPQSVAPVAAPAASADAEPEDTGRRRPVQPVQPAQSASQSMAPPADIKVAGIAWQDMRSARRAVVNGFLLKEGSVVAGAKIVEILPDKVRFSMSGRTFEVSMQSTAVSGAVK